MKQLIKKFMPKKVFRALEPSYHLVEAAIFASLNGFPGRKMKIIAVTGTNGKTSTCFMIHRILVEAGVKTGLMTTVSYGIDNDIVDQKEHVTTSSAPVSQKRLREFHKQGVEWVVLETTSHAMAQHRLFGVPFDVGVLTNITHEHLDYHGTFENYAKAKIKLLKNTAKNGGVMVINADDPASVEYTKPLEGKKVYYGIENGDVRAKNIKLSGAGSDYQTEINGEKLQIKCQIPGEFNVYNSLAAMLAAEAAGVDVKLLAPGLAKLEGVEGRMDTVREGQKFTAIIDFAHTPDSFEKLLSDLRRSTKGKLVAVFGSAGRRDEAKRAVQGEIAGKYADEVVLTEEDDRDIDGAEILAQIAKGAEKSGKVKDKDMFLIGDRKEAIQFAVTRVNKSDDTVIFLGKGHEKTIERADGEHGWNELDEVKKAISQLLG